MSHHSRAHTRCRVSDRGPVHTFPIACRQVRSLLSEHSAAYAFERGRRTSFEVSASSIECSMPILCDAFRRIGGPGKQLIKTRTCRPTVEESRTTQVFTRTDCLLHSILRSFRRSRGGLLPWSPDRRTDFGSHREEHHLPAQFAGATPYESKLTRSLATQTPASSTVPLGDLWA